MIPIVAYRAPIPPAFLSSLSFQELIKGRYIVCRGNLIADQIDITRRACVRVDNRHDPTH